MEESVNNDAAHHRPTPSSRREYSRSRSQLQQAFSTLEDSEVPQIPIEVENSETGVRTPNRPSISPAFQLSTSDVQRSSPDPPQQIKEEPEEEDDLPESTPAPIDPSTIAIVSTEAQGLIQPRNTENQENNQNEDIVASTNVISDGNNGLNNINSSSIVPEVDTEQNRINPIPQVPRPTISIRNHRREIDSLITQVRRVRLEMNNLERIGLANPTLGTTSLTESRRQMQQAIALLRSMRRNFYLRENFASKDDYWCGRSSLESGFRAILRIISHGVICFFLILHLIDLRSDVDKTLPEGLNLNSKAILLREGDNGVPHGLFFRYCCIVRIIEHVLSCLDYLNFWMKKKKVFCENYVHTAFQIFMYSFTWLMLRNGWNWAWPLFASDLVLRILLIALAIGKSNIPVFMSYKNMNVVCFCLTGPTALLVCLKVFGNMAYWAVALIPGYIGSFFVLLTGVILFGLKKYSYRDFWGKFS